MIITKIRALAAAKDTVARLESEIEAELQSELASLHENYGFVDVESFVIAVEEASGGKKVGKRWKKRAAPKTRKRAKITDAIRARVKKLVQSGKSGSVIAKAVGVSLPSVQNIKKSFGLVKSRKPKKAKKRRTSKRAAKKTPAPQVAAPETPKSEAAST